MYRKIALTSVTINVAFVFVTLFVFVPWFMNVFKNLKVEMPMPIMWLVNASHFATSPLGVVASILIIGFFGVKALRKRTTNSAA